MPTASQQDIHLENRQLKRQLLTMRFYEVVLGLMVLTSLGVGLMRWVRGEGFVVPGLGGGEFTGVDFILLMFFSWLVQISAVQRRLIERFEAS